MFFNKESQLVKEQVMLIKNGFIAKDKIPDIFNLKEVVLNVINDEVDVQNIEGGDKDGIL